MEFAYKCEQFVACYVPLKGYFGKTVNPKTGRRPIVFNIGESFSGVPINLPCGECVGCRLERGRQWAVRIIQEQRLYRESSFLTLTYDDVHLPKDGSLVLRDLQLFMKVLRRRRETGLRFFACGEYGELTLRPHYHVLLLNTMFHDCRCWKMSGDQKLYVSAEVSELWPHGDHYIGDVTFASASYVAGYCVKKVGFKVLGDRCPEFVTMSRRPGIGALYFEKYGSAALKHDNVIIDGKPTGVPRFYSERFVGPKILEGVKKKRRVERMKRRADNLVDRRRVKARIAEIGLERRVRDVVGRGC